MTQEGRLDASIAPARPLLLGGVFAPLVLFAVIAWTVFGFDAIQTDTRILLEIHHHLRSGPADRVMRAASDIGRWPTMSLATGLITFGLVVLGRTRDAGFVVLAATGSRLLNLALKATFERTRPALWTSPAPETSASFPSGHAMGSATFALTAVALSWRTRWRWPVLAACVAGAVTISSSRMYLGVHYPTDVLAGWLASAAWVSTCWLALAPRRGRRVHQR